MIIIAKILFTDKEFLSQLKYICDKIPTVYMPSGTLTPVTTSNVKKFKSWCPNAWSNGKADIRIANVLDKGTHVGADCNNLIKALIWGADVTLGLKAETKMVRNSNGLKDVTTEQLYALCTDKSTDMTSIQAGELMHFKGHVGIYYGKISGVDYVIDSTPSLNGVRLNKMSRQKWTGHGKLPWVEYTTAVKYDLEGFLDLVNVRAGIKRGDKNNFVKIVQERLLSIGYSVGSCGADGSYGSATEKALTSFKKKYNITEDGCGIFTLAKLCEEIKA